MAELTKEEQVFLGVCQADTKEYAKFFYQDRFNVDFSYQHEHIFNAIDERNADGTPTNNRIVIKAGRGIGKTSICKTIVAKRLRFQQVHLVGYIGKSHDFASLQTEAIKNGMLQNQREGYFFGDIKATTDDNIRQTFSVNSWVTSTGGMVVPRGCQQPVRGYNFDWNGSTYRFGLIILDDLEDPEKISSEIYRQKTKEYLLADVVEAVPLEKVSMDWQIIYIDTLKHEDSCLQMLLDSDDWLHLDFAICDDNYKSLIPGFISDETIAKKVQHHRKRGTLDVFYRESGLGAISKESPAFRTSYFKHYSETDKQFQDELKANEIETFLLVDPTKSATPNSADSSLLVTGINQRRNKWYLRDIILEKIFADDLYEQIYNLCTRYHINVLGIEVNSLNEYITYPLRSFMLKKGMFLDIVDLKPRTQAGGGEDPKVHRAKQLIPFYRQGVIYHNETIAGLIETPLLSFPRPKKWDAIDTVAYIIQMLEQGGRYFSQDNIDDCDDPLNLELEYAKLDNEPVLAVARCC